MLNLTKSTIQENKETNIKKNIKKTYLIYGTMLRKLRLRQKKWFSYEKTV